MLNTPESPLHDDMRTTRAIFRRTVRRAGHAAGEDGTQRACCTGWSMQAAVRWQQVCRRLINPAHYFPNHSRTSPARRRPQSGVLGPWKMSSCRCLQRDAARHGGGVFGLRHKQAAMQPHSMPCPALSPGSSPHCLTCRCCSLLQSKPPSQQPPHPCPCKRGAPDRPKKRATSPPGPTLQPELRGIMPCRGRCQLSSMNSACFMHPAYWEPRMTWQAEQAENGRHFAKRLVHEECLLGRHHSQRDDSASSKG